MLVRTASQKSWSGCSDLDQGDWVGTTVAHWNGDIITIIRGHWFCFLIMVSFCFLIMVSYYHDYHHHNLHHDHRHHYFISIIAIIIVIISNIRRTGSNLPIACGKLAWRSGTSAFWRGTSFESACFSLVSWNYQRVCCRSQQWGAFLWRESVPHQPK